jgi:hypothetical protein
LTNSSRQRAEKAKASGGRFLVLKQRGAKRVAGPDGSASTAKGAKAMRSPFVLMTALALAGCATTHEPRRGPRIHQVVDEGRVVLVRDGRKLTPDANGLWQAVRGNHEAEQHAARYGMWTSFGLASMLVGSGLVAGAGYAETRDSIPARNSLATAGVAAAWAGLVMMLVAQPRYYDAINVYNDAVDENRRLHSSP